MTSTTLMKALGSCGEQREVLREPQAGGGGMLVPTGRNPGAHLQSHFRLPSFANKETEAQGGDVACILSIFFNGPTL